MRVVHICNLPLPSDHPDANRLALHPGRWVLNLAKAQQAHAGIRAELVVQIPGSARDHSTEIEGIPVHFLAAPDRLRAATLFFFDARRIARRVRELAPDLVHAHGTEDAYLLAAQATGLPTLVTLQGCHFLINRELPPRAISRERIIGFIEAIALSRAKHAIAKSRYIGDELRKKFPNLGIHEIPNTFDPALLDIPIDQPREPGSVAFVGTIAERKGVHVLARAVEILAKSEQSVRTLHIFGDRPGQESPYEAAQKARLQNCLGDRVIFHGTVPARQVAESLARIHLLVAPSLEEMFGNQFIEASLVGTQAVVTEGTAMAENAARLGAGAIVPQNKPAALAASIRGVLASPNEVAEKQMIRDRILEWMGPERVARKHLDLYEQIVGSGVPK